MIRWLYECTIKDDDLILPFTDPEFVFVIIDIFFFANSFLIKKLVNHELILTKE